MPNLEEVETLLEQLIDDCNEVENSPLPWRSHARREASFRGNVLRVALNAIRECQLAYDWSEPLRYG